MSNVLSIITQSGRNAQVATSLLQALLCFNHQADIRMHSVACSNFMITSLLQVVNGLDVNSLSRLGRKCGGGGGGTPPETYISIGLQMSVVGLKI